MDLGQIGETIAARFLEKQGHRILDRNFQFAHGEIDIISWKKGILIFTEVKTRRSLRYGRPLEAVDAFKRRQIYQTAAFYLQTQQVSYRATRFDVIEVFIGAKSMIHYLPDAFSGNDLED